MQLPRSQGVANGGALCSPPVRGLRLSVRNDSVLQLVKKPSVRFSLFFKKTSFRLISVFQEALNQIQSDFQEDVRLSFFQEAFSGIDFQ